MEALIGELGELDVPDLPEYEPDEVAFGDDRNTAFYEVLDAYPRALRLGDLMWQHHFEFLLLGYGAYGTFVGVLQGPPARHPRPAHRADGRGDRRAPVPARRRAAPARAPGDRDRRRRRVRSRAARRSEIDAELAKSDAGQSWLAELEKVKDPWFNMATGDGLYHYYRSWLDDPSIPYASLIGHISALNAGEQIDRPTEEIAARARPAGRRSTARCSTRSARRAFNDLLGLSRTVFPYVEEHKFFCDYWFLTRWWNKIREFGALLAAQRLPRGRRGRLPALALRGRERARRAGADLGHGRPARSARRTGRRSSRGARSSSRSSATGRRRRRSASPRTRSPTR